MLLSHSQGPLRNSAWTSTNSKNALVEPWHNRHFSSFFFGHFSSDDILGFPSGASSLSLLRYVGARPRPGEVPALCLDLFGKKNTFGKKSISIEIARIYTASFLIYLFFLYYYWKDSQQWAGPNGCILHLFYILKVQLHQLPKRICISTSSVWRYPQENYCHSSSTFQPVQWVLK